MVIWEEIAAAISSCLKKLGAQFDFNVVGIPPVTVNGEIVSSTTIRRAVESGDLKKAATMLGREYTILGTVVHGDDLGKKIGFPTANLSAHSEQFPPNGVYFAEAKARRCRLSRRGESRISAD